VPKTGLVTPYTHGPLVIKKKIGECLYQFFFKVVQLTSSLKCQSFEGDSAGLEAMP
jgi:hypothetical protein